MRTIENTAGKQVEKYGDSETVIRKKPGQPGGFFI